MAGFWQLPPSLPVRCGAVHFIGVILVLTTLHFTDRNAGWLREGEVLWGTHVLDPPQPLAKTIFVPDCCSLNMRPHSCSFCTQQERACLLPQSAGFPRSLGASRAVPPGVGMHPDPALGRAAELCGQGTVRVLPAQVGMGQVQDGQWAWAQRRGCLVGLSQVSR